MNEYVQGKVGPPGIALTVFGLLCVAVNLLSGILILIGSLGALSSLISNGSGAAWMQFLMGTGWQIVMSLIAFGVAFIVTFAGLRLRSARSPGLVYTGAILSMIPCCVSYCCCFGIPIGIWVIVTMQDEQVKAAFAEQF